MTNSNNKDGERLDDLPAAAATDDNNDGSLESPSNDQSHHRQQQEDPTPSLLSRGDVDPLEKKKYDFPADITEVEEEKSPDTSDDNDNHDDISSGDWPNLWEEAFDMMIGSNIVYAMAALRQAARQGKLPKDTADRMLNLPITAGNVLAAFTENKESLEEVLGEEHFSIFLSGVMNQIEKIRISTAAETGEINYNAQKIVVFDDENSNSELVYLIGVDSALKRIVIIFRGTVSLQDFLTDARATMSYIPCPLASAQGMYGGFTKNVGIHNGFLNYLFGVHKNQSKSKLDIILDKLRVVLDQYPGYRLYVTGHSLGGALSTLFACHAAAKPSFPKPVSCFTFASPKVGNLRFRRSFQTLENWGHLRCLRVANFRDVVTYIPGSGTFSCLYNSCFPDSLYRHVGIKLKLRGNKRYCFLRPSQTDNCLVRYFRDLKKIFKETLYFILSIPFFLFCCCLCWGKDAMEKHSCKLYLDRLDELSEDLNQIFLNDLYKDKGKVFESMT